MVFQIPLGDYERNGAANPVLSKVDTAEVLRVLRQDRAEVVLILRVRFKKPTRHPVRVCEELGIHGQLLDANNEWYTFLGKFHPANSHPGLRVFSKSGYFIPPIEVRDGHFRFTFVGTVSEGQQLIESFRRSRIRHRIISASDARFDPDSPLNALTDRQYKVLRMAFQLGYFDRPRRVSSRELARRVGVSTSTLVNHRLKAERRLLQAVMNLA